MISTVNILRNIPQCFTFYIKNKKRKHEYVKKNHYENEMCYTERSHNEVCRGTCSNSYFILWHTKVQKR